MKIRQLASGGFVMNGQRLLIVTVEFPDGNYSVYYMTTRDGLTPVQAQYEFQECFTGCLMRGAMLGDIIVDVS